MSNQKTGYIIIGGGAAGMTAAQVIAKRDRNSEITVLSEEPDKPYFRPMIPLLINGQKKASDMALVGSGVYKSDVPVKLNAKVSKVNPKDKFVALNDGEELRYDKILFATGASPYIPPALEGIKADGLFALRTMADAKAIAERSEVSRQAVLLGAGLLNVRTALALLKKGLEVTLVDNSSEILPRLMDADDASLIREVLLKEKIQIITGVDVSGILSDDGGVTGTILDDGRELPCQILCVGAGVEPNVSFLKDSGVDIDGGIVVDRFTACNVEDAYAAGDAALNFNPVTGEKTTPHLWTSAVEMGMCAGLNMTGSESPHGGSFDIFNAFEVLGVPFTAMGVVHTENANYEVHVSETAKSRRKLVFDPEGEKLVGALLIGDISKAGLYRYLIKENMFIKNVKKAIIAHRLNYGYFLK